MMTHFIMPLNAAALFMAFMGGIFGWLNFRRSRTPLPFGSASKVYGRIRLMSVVDGGGLLIFGAISMLISLFSLDWMGIALSSVLLYSGHEEIFGRFDIEEGDPRGMDRMIRAQQSLILVGCLYFVISGVTVSAQSVVANMSPDYRDPLIAAGLDMDSARKLMEGLGRAIYGGCLFGLLTFQGALLGYYVRARRMFAWYLPQRFPSAEESSSSGASIPPPRIDN